MPIFVSNPKDHPVILRSYDGDSVHVPAKVRKARVANKFAWHAPKFVRVEDGGPDKGDIDKLVTTPPIVPAIRAPKSAAEAKALVSAMTGDKK